MKSYLSSYLYIFPREFNKVHDASDEGMTPRSSIFAYPVPAKEKARSKDTRSPQGPALRLVNPNWLHL
jgi:hypothetical protein